MKNYRVQKITRACRNCAHVDFNPHLTFRYYMCDYEFPTKSENVIGKRHVDALGICDDWEGNLDMAGVSRELIESNL